MVVLSSFIQPDRPVRLEQLNTRVIIDKKDIGLGTLFICDSSLNWSSGNAGFCLSYPNIAVHAVSNDPNVYESECVYVMIDTAVTIPGVTYEDRPSTEDTSDSEEESEPGLSEMLIVPQDLAAVPLIYEAIKQCQLLHPDPEAIEEEDEDDIFEDADEEHSVQVGPGGDNGVQDHNMDELSNQLQQQIEINYDYNDPTASDDIYIDAD